ncbi:unnamed protein product [marine sediment metagenome]|uniref:Ribbon-helix-helix protein CopG domain-containing protein n=3 Tax=marine sediment metagenome TaxID=412755 RepID=X0Z700_9ZZZZ
MVRKVLSLSLHPSLYKEYEKLAKKSGKNKSQLFREMIFLYEQEKMKDDFYKIQRKISKVVRKKGIYTEEDVKKIVFEER